MSGPIVSLLPARNAADDLPGHLDSVAAFADLVVALDDGSTDDTRSVLEAHPLVHTVLTNPRREGYAGWNDAANRNRLLGAALELRPSWAMSLDSDELITADDAEALRGFLLEEADPADAYLFRVFRMIGDLEHHDGSELWVGRLFAPRPGHRFPDDKLHFVPLPTAIPSDRWRKTTVRIQHRGSLTEEQRQARFAKYREADPDRRWQRSYDHLLAAPQEPLKWWDRSPLLPVIANDPVDPDSTETGEQGGHPRSPVLSVAVLASGDDADVSEREDLLTRIDEVACRGGDGRFEVVVVTGPALATEVAAARAEVRTVTVAGGASPGAVRNAALRASSGAHVVFLDGSTSIAPGHLTALVEAHGRGWPMVAGGASRLAGSWTDRADALLDRSSELPGRGAFRFDVAPRSCSFRRELLDEIGGFNESLPADVEAVAAAALFERGYGAFRTDGAARLPRRSPHRPSWLAHRYAVGRTQGLVLAASVRAGGSTKRRAVRRLIRSLPGGLRRVARDVRRWSGPDLPRALAVAPLVAVGASVSWAGCAVELTRQLADERRSTLRRASLTR